MKRFIRLLLPVLFIAVSVIDCFSQSEDHGVIFWSQERNLEWEDFKGRPMVDSLDNFYLDLYIESSNIAENEAFFLFGVRPSAYIFTNTSYVDDDIKNDDLLRYLNVYFDLAGYYAYKMTIGVNQANKSENEVIRNNPTIVRNAIIEEWRTESSRLAFETQYGVEIEKLLLWEQEINEKLLEVKEPEIKVSDYALGFEFSAGYLLDVANYEEFLTKPIVGAISMEITKAPFIYSIGFTGGGNEVKKTFNKGNDVFLKDTEPNIANLFLHGGYLLINSNKFRVAPRLGINFSHLRYPTDSDFDGNVWSVFYVTGITIDWKFLTWSAKGYKDQSLSDLSLRLGSYYYPINYGDNNFSNMSFNVGVSWTIGGGTYLY